MSLVSVTFLNLPSKHCRMIGAVSQSDGLLATDGTGRQTEAWETEDNILKSGEPRSCLTFKPVMSDRCGRSQSLPNFDPNHCSSIKIRLICLQDTMKLKKEKKSFQCYLPVQSSGGVISFLSKIRLSNIVQQPGPFRKNRPKV